MTLPQDPSLMQREHNRCARASNIHAAEYHRDHHVPRHFEGFAGAKYGYWKRQKAYKERKQKIVGNKPDLVFSGQSKREVTSQKPKPRGTPKGATLILKLPISGGTGRVLDQEAAARLFAAGKRKTATFTKKQVQSQIQIMRRVAELRAVSPDEARTLQRVKLEEYVRLANLPTTKKRIRIRTK